MQVSDPFCQRRALDVGLTPLRNSLSDVIPSPRSLRARHSRACAQRAREKYGGNSGKHPHCTGDCGPMLVLHLIRDEKGSLDGGSGLKRGTVSDPSRQRRATNAGQTPSLLPLLRFNPRRWPIPISHIAFFAMTPPFIMILKFLPASAIRSRFATGSPSTRMRSA